MLSPFCHVFHVILVALPPGLQHEYNMRVSVGHGDLIVGQVMSRAYSCKRGFVAQQGERGDHSPHTHTHLHPPFSLSHPHPTPHLPLPLLPAFTPPKPPSDPCPAPCYPPPRLLSHLRRAQRPFKAALLPCSSSCQRGVLLLLLSACSWQQ